ncbi:hypothetical protein GS432_04875 [Rhodococcus hoagii]|nr:hypothetical protein [Prescottella equi]
MTTTMHYSGSLGSGTYADKGPAISVAKNATTTTLAPVSAPVTAGPVGHPHRDGDRWCAGVMRSTSTTARPRWEPEP